MTLMRMVATLGALAILPAYSLPAQEKVASVTDPEAYAVYASLLPNEWGNAGQAKRLVLQQETVTLPRCMPSGKPLEAEWRTVIENYGQENANGRTLLPGQRLGLDYDVVSASAIRSFPAYIQVSAVGFNESKTRALVYVAHFCGNLCGRGRHYLLEKTDGGWREARLEGVVECRWIA